MRDMVDVFEVEIRWTGDITARRRGFIKKEMFEQYGDGKEIHIGISLCPTNKNEHFLCSLEALQILHFNRILGAYREFRRLPTSGNNDSIIKALADADSRASGKEEFQFEDAEKLKEYCRAFLKQDWGGRNFITSKVAKALKIQQQSGEDA